MSWISYTLKKKTNIEMRNQNDRAERSIGEVVIFEKNAHRFLKSKCGRVLLTQLQKKWERLGVFGTPLPILSRQIPFISPVFSPLTVCQPIIAPVEQSHFLFSKGEYLPAPVQHYGY